MGQKKKSYRLVTSPKKPERPPNHPSKRRCWSNEAMLGAMDAVQKDGVGVNVAAAQFGVPPSTLRNCLSGQVVHGTNPGPVRYLTRSEESELVEYLHSTSKIGYGKTRQQVMNIVEHVTKEKGVLRKAKLPVVGSRDSKSAIQLYARERVIEWPPSDSSVQLQKLLMTTMTFLKLC